MALPLKDIPGQIVPLIFPIFETILHLPDDLYMIG